jgi:ADP-ribose pyrophosphatase
MATFRTSQLGDGRQLRFLQMHVHEDPYWEYVTRSNATDVVAIVAVTERREIVLVRQPRIPLGGTVIELPAGLVGDTRSDETPQEAVQKELREETGYQVEPDHLERLARGPISPGLTDEMIGLWLARDVRFVGRGHDIAPDDARIETLLFPLATVREQLHVREAAGDLVDLKVFAGLHFLPDAKRLA